MNNKVERDCRRCGGLPTTPRCDACDGFGVEYVDQLEHRLETMRDCSIGRVNGRWHCYVYHSALDRVIAKGEGVTVADAVEMAFVDWESINPRVRGVGAA